LVLGLFFGGGNFKSALAIFDATVTLTEYYKKSLRQAGLSETLRLHDLRHACASLLPEQGVHLKVIQELLGHSSINMTANVYGHIHETTMKEVANKMDKILGG
jgi:integrase